MSETSEGTTSPSARLSVQLKLTSDARCAFCHDALDEDSAICAGCHTVLHRDCREALLECPTIGCRASAFSVVPDRPWQRPAHMRQSFLHAMESYKRWDRSVPLQRGPAPAIRYSAEPAPDRSPYEEPFPSLREDVARQGGPVRLAARIVGRLIVAGLGLSVSVAVLMGALGMDPRALLVLGAVGVFGLGMVLMAAAGNDRDG